MNVPYNALLYLVITRLVFCIRAIVKPNQNKVCKKQQFSQGDTRYYLSEQKSLVIMSNAYK